MSILSSQLSFLPFPQYRVASELGRCLRVSLLLTRHEPLQCHGRQLAACASLCAWGQPLFLSLDAAFSWLPGGDRPHLLLQAMHRCARRCCLQPAGKAGIEGCRGNERIEAMKNGSLVLRCLPGAPEADGLKAWTFQSRSICVHRRGAVWMTDTSPIFQNAETRLTSGVSPKFVGGVKKLRQEVPSSCSTTQWYSSITFV